MKHVATLVAVFIFLLALAQGAIAQEPPLDLAITELSYACVSPGVVFLEAEVQLATIDSIGDIITSVEFYADGASVGAVLYDVTPVLPGLCKDSPYPDCDGSCEPTAINGTLTTGVCTPFLGRCACLYLVYKPYTAAVEEYSSLTATVDPTNDIEELDESNNSMTIMADPSAVQGTVWGTVKALYR
jgi:hypothetical protein